MKALAMLAVVAAASPASAQTPASDGTGQTIVVTGVPLASTGQALADCLRRACPPAEDITRSLAHAENLFVAGRYRDARSVLDRALGRNGRHTAVLPVPVSKLYRGHARVSAHLGEKNDYISSTFGIRRALAAGLPRHDPRLVAATLEIAAMQAETYGLFVAKRRYDEAETAAERIGRADLAAVARLRSAWLSYNAGQRISADKTLRSLAASDDPSTRMSKLAAMVLLARARRREGRAGPPDALIAALRDAGQKEPALLYAPPLGTAGATFKEFIGSATARMPTTNVEKRWIDVGFWVRPAGNVADVELLRASGSAGWSGPLLRSIAGRVYSPSDLVGEGVYRVERYTLTAFWDTVVGSRLRQREPNTRIEYLDLTAPRS